jgi:hypothetical protein
MSEASMSGSMNDESVHVGGRINQTNDLVANQVRFDSQAHNEPAINTTVATVALSHEIEIDETYRVLNSPASRGGYAFYVALIVGLLAATCGLVWMTISMSVLPFGLASVGASSGNRSVSSRPDQGLNVTSDRMPDTHKGDRLEIHDTIVREIHRDAPKGAQQGPNLSSVSTASGRCATVECLLLDGDSGAGLTHATLTGAKAEGLQTRTKLAPTPETRPTTIKGWTLREVADGTAVLEGPNGVWRATPGQTVPGVGRVDSIVRWGNRLIVATSRGLISTP